jgi:3-deoxy-D-manno-octulosonate 8-phosphate phosphatase (KDO 8-P phosphatase)
MTLREKLLRLRLLAMDVDGVLTDGTIYLGNEGEELKGFDVKDGLGIRLACEAGLILAFVTGRTSRIVERRARELGVSEVVQGTRRKDEALRRLAEKYGLSWEEVGFIGDDWNDWPALEWAGCTFAPADAFEDIRRNVDWVTSSPGGRGAVREVIELILRTQGKYEEALQRFLSPPSKPSQEASLTDKGPM